MSANSIESKKVEKSITFTAVKLKLLSDTSW